MKVKQQDSEFKSENSNRAGLAVQSGMRAGYSCPDGWWKKKVGKDKMCCHWVRDQRYGYKPECTT